MTFCWKEALTWQKGNTNSTVTVYAFVNPFDSHLDLLLPSVPCRLFHPAVHPNLACLVSQPLPWTQTHLGNTKEWQQISLDNRFDKKNSINIQMACQRSSQSLMRALFSWKTEFEIRTFDTWLAQNSRVSSLSSFACCSGDTWFPWPPINTWFSWLARVPWESCLPTSNGN